MTGSSGHWSGPGSFAFQSSPSTTVTSSLGVQVFKWREENGICWDEDFVTVTFVQEPGPTTISNVDTVCANTYNLNVLNSVYDGYWTAYSGDPLTVMTPAPLYSPSISSPEASATIRITSYNVCYTKLLRLQYRYRTDRICGKAGNICWRRLWCMW